MDDIDLFDFLGAVCVVVSLAAAGIVPMMLAAVLLGRLSRRGESTESGDDPHGLLSIRTLVCCTMGIPACFAALGATHLDAQREYWADCRRMVAALLIGIGVTGVTLWVWGTTAAILRGRP